MPTEYNMLLETKLGACMKSRFTHANNQDLVELFKRHLLFKTFGRFKFTLPETWAENYFLYSLFLGGHVAVFDTGVENMGVICQHGGLYGYDVFYQPTGVVIANPCLKQYSNLKIDDNCVIVKLLPDYGGIGETVALFADLMACACEAAGVNIQNSILSYVLMCRNKGASETLKDLVDTVLSGKPAVAADSRLFNDKGDPVWMEFAQDLRSNFIAPDLLNTLRDLQQQFDDAIGFPNANTGKRERMLVDEVNVNNASTQSKADVMLHEIKISFDKANTMFGLKLAVEFTDSKSGKELQPNDDQRNLPAEPPAV